MSSNGGAFLPTVGKQAQLISEPNSPMSPKSPKGGKGVPATGDGDGNMFLLTKEEELAKVHNSAALATLDKVEIWMTYYLKNTSC
jgi:hypothetical protein